MSFPYPDTNRAELRKRLRIATCATILARSIPKEILQFLEGLDPGSVYYIMTNNISKLLSGSILLLVLAGSATVRADEMTWTLRNKSGMKCELVGGMTLKRGVDFVETKHLVCKRGMATVVTATASCGPEGSITRFDGHKIKVTCEMSTYASK
jgi:hypothetical protein